MKIEQIGRPEIKMLRDEIQQAIDGIAKKYDLKLVVGRGAYGGHEGSLKVEIEVPALAAAAANEMLRLFGARFEVGFEFKEGNGEVFKVTGVATKRGKYPVESVRLKDGKPYKHTLEGVNRAAVKAGLV